MAEDEHALIEGQFWNEPANSLEARIEASKEALVPYYYMPVGLLLMVIYEWLRLVHKYQPQPMPITLLILVVIFFCALKVVRTRGEIRTLEARRDGERQVDEQIRRLQSAEAAVLPAFQGEGTPAGRVVISAHGIFFLETVTPVRAKRGRGTITVKDGRVYADGTEIPDDPIGKARRRAQSLCELLSRSEGGNIPVRPVVLFPGWSVEAQGAGEQVWVLEPGTLPAAVAGAPMALSEAQVCQATFQLTRSIRTIQSF